MADHSSIRKPTWNGQIHGQEKETQRAATDCATVLSET